MANPNLQKIIKLTQSQYNTLANGGTVGDYTGLNDNYLYLIQEDYEFPVTTTARKILMSTNTAGLVSWESLTANDIPSLDASKINSGIFNTSRIPNLNASKITGGTFDIARIPTGTTASTVALGNHNHDSTYLKLSGGTVTGKLQVNALIFGYNYTNSNNRAAFMFDKPGSNYTGIGAHAESDTIYFGACDGSGNWVDTYKQKWKFNGTIIEDGTSLSDKYLGINAKAADADKLDGQDSTYYLNYNNLTNKPTIPSVSNATITIKQTGISDQTFTLNGSAVTITLVDTNTWRPLGTGATDACAGNDSRLSNARPASDVYAWAKAATKPSYTLDEVTDGSTRKLSNYLTKIAYEWNKDISFGSSGYLKIGSFQMYDSNVTIDIDATTSTTYHGTVVIATQNTTESSIGSAHAIRVYGDPSGTIADSLRIVWTNGSRNYDVYFVPQPWSKNIIHIRANGIYGATDICISQTGTPPSTTSGLEPVNVLTTTFLGISDTAADSNKLNGQAASYYAPKAWVGENYLGINAKAADSNKLNGQLASYYATATHDHDGVYVKYSAAQTLTDAQKQQARSNIGAGTSSFTGYTSSNKLHTDYINNAAGWTSVTESTVSGWGFTKNAGTVTQVKIGTTPYNPSSGVISLPAYPTTLPANGGDADTVNGYDSRDFARSVIVGSTTYSVSDGVVSLPAYPTTLPASDVYAWAKASTKPSYNFGEISAGNLTVGSGNYYLNMRSGHNSYNGGIYYSTPGNEAIVFANKNAVTSWIFATTDVTGMANWTGLTPSMQIKNGSVVINKLIADGASASYNLDVNGTLNATTIYQNSTTLDNTYLGKSATAADSNKLNGQAASYYLNYNNFTNTPTIPTESTVTNWGFTKNIGTVTSITLGLVAYNPDSSGVVALPAYPTTLPASDVYSWAKQPSKPSYTYSEVGAAPASHSHYSLTTEGDNRYTDTQPNDYNNLFKFSGLKQNSYIGSPSTDSYSYVFGLRGWSDSSGGNAYELAFNDTNIYFRKGATTSWGGWNYLIHSGNISSQHVYYADYCGNAISTSVLTAVGDIIYAGAAGTAMHLTIGSSGQFLGVSSNGIPEWKNLPVSTTHVYEHVVNLRINYGIYVFRFCNTSSENVTLADVHRRLYGIMLCNAYNCGEYLVVHSGTYVKRTGTLTIDTGEYYQKNNSNVMLRYSANGFSITIDSQSYSEV